MGVPDAPELVELVQLVMMRVSVLYVTFWLVDGKGGVPGPSVDAVTVVAGDAVVTPVEIPVDPVLNE